MFRSIISKFGIRYFSGFKKPPPGYTFQKPPIYPKPDYIFKRPVVPSDLELPEYLKNTNKFDCENEKWTDSGKEMFKPKYGNSHYEYEDKDVWKEKK